MQFVFHINIYINNTTCINICYQIQHVQIYYIKTSVDTEMCCPKGKCGCQYFILLT